MDAQELLTYIEDLTFKKSMRGYDANEVDDQLDRICDEIEAIARDKDDPEVRYMFQIKKEAQLLLILEAV